MKLYEFAARVHLPVSATDAFAWHERPGALERMSPPWENIRVVERHGTIHDGDRVTVRVGNVRFEHVHRDYVAGRQFRDEQVRGPFKRFVHTHTISPEGDRSVLDDNIEYALPLGMLGRVANGMVHARIARGFAYRHSVLVHDLARHAAIRDRPRMRVAITGASGVLGTALRAFLTTGGHDVVPVVRREARAGEIRWDPSRGEIDAAACEGLDAVVHLAGENIAGKRWTEARKRSIVSSRVDATDLLARTLAALQRPPRVLVAASAVGIYGTSAPSAVDETSPPGDDFLADLCRSWELATAPARDAMRVVNLRIGVVLTPAGGALAEMLPVFRKGLGGPIGKGSQVISWISLEDTLGSIYHALFDDTLAGPVNAVAPRAVTNAEFAATLGRVLRRPAGVRVPAFAIDVLFGEMGSLTALAGVEVLPRRLHERNFPFAFSELEPALRHVLGR